MFIALAVVWRHLQRRLTGQLLERMENGETYLDRMLRRYVPAKGSLSEALEAANIADLTLDHIRVLEHYSAGRYRSACRAWLRGEGLAEVDRVALGVSDRLNETLEDDGAESAARAYVLATARLIAPEPLIFCFDQLEALGLSGAANSYGPFTKMCACLVDETPHSLVLCSILSTYLGDLERQSMVSDYHRISKQVIDLHPLDRGLGHKLIQARLDSIDELKPFRNGGGVAPLRAEEIDAIFKANHGACPARKLIHEARKMFAKWSGAKAAPAEAETEFVRKRFEQFWEASLAHADGTHTGEILLAILSQASGLAGHKIQPGTHKELPFMLNTPQGPVFVAFAGETNMNSLGARLKRILEAAGEGKRVAVIRDPRLTVSQKAKVVNDRLAKMDAAGIRFVRPHAEAVAAMDAMRRLLAEATSGDLTHQGETVRPESVREWLAANLPDALRGLVDDVAGGSAAPVRTDAALELLAAERVIEVTEMSRRLGWTVEQVEQYARTNPEQAGILAGQPAIVFHVVDAPVRSAVADA